jgi:hypothetical protein
VSTTIGRDHVVDLVVGNRRPCTVHLNFIVVANHATLSRPTIHQIAARALAIVSFEFRVETLMPFIVTHPVVSFLRGRVYINKQGDRTAKKSDAIPPRNVHSIASSTRIHRLLRARAARSLVAAAPPSRTTDSRRLRSNMAVSSRLVASLGASRRQSRAVGLPRSLPRIGRRVVGAA